MVSLLCENLIFETVIFKKDIAKTNCQKILSLLGAFINIANALGAFNSTEDSFSRFLTKKKVSSAYHLSTALNKIFLSSLHGSCPMIIETGSYGINKLILTCLKI